MRTCKICDREFAAPHCLRAHYVRFHPQEEQPKYLRAPRKVKGGDVKDVHYKDTDKNMIATVRLTPKQLFQLVKNSKRLVLTSIESARKSETKKHASPSTTHMDQSTQTETLTAEQFKPERPKSLALASTTESSSVIKKPFKKRPINRSEKRDRSKLVKLRSKTAQVSKWLEECSVEDSEMRSDCAQNASDALPKSVFPSKLSNDAC